MTLQQLNDNWPDHEAAICAAVAAKLNIPATGSALRDRVRSVLDTLLDKDRVTDWGQGIDGAAKEAIEAAIAEPVSKPVAEPEPKKTTTNKKK